MKTTLTSNTTKRQCDYPIDKSTGLTALKTATETIAASQSQTEKSKINDNADSVETIDAELDATNGYAASTQANNSHMPDVATVPAVSRIY